MQSDNIEEEERKQTQLIYDSGQRLLGIINNLLNMARLDGGYERPENTPFNLYESIIAVQSLLLKPIQANQIDFNIEYSTKFKDFIADSDKIQQIITNLAGNAVKFTSKGNVTIKVDCDEPIDGSVKCSIHVSDSGLGIPEDKIPLLFGRFYQVDGVSTRKYGGTGLGLAISQSLAKLLDGEITVKSEQGKGSTFTLTIPLTLNLNKQKACADNTPYVVTKLQDVRVLLAEDNATNALYCTCVLNKTGCKVDVAEDGQAVLNLMEYNDYDIIVMDYQMPVMNGLDCTRAIREKEKGTGKHIPIIALTAGAFKEDERNCIEAGMDDYMSKPIPRNVLEDKIVKWTSPVPSV